MSKRITVEELAANLEKHLAEARSGESLTIVEEGQEIANLTPPLVVQRGIRYPFRDFNPGPRPKGLKSDPVEILIEEREHDRSGKRFKP